MTPFEELIHTLIAERGPITFAEYQDLALYHPVHGYYSGTERSGWRGDYLTSAELDPAFGELWAEGLRRLWRACGAPERFEVVEVGPGEGGLAAGLLAASEGDFAAALSLHLVEPSPPARERQKRRLGRTSCSWAASLDDLRSLSVSCVIANEVLDNLPQHLLTARGGEVAELRVGEQRGDLVLLPGALSPAAADALSSGLWDPPSLGRDVAVSPVAARLVAAAARLVERGAVVLIDYGREGGGPEIVCYSGRGADDRPLEHPGAKDITAHVDWTALRRALEAAGMTVAGPLAQRDVLFALGAEAVEAKLRREHDRALEKGQGADAVRALARRSALGALTDPGGLGGLSVLTGYRGAGGPPWTRHPVVEGAVR